MKKIMKLLTVIVVSLLVIFIAWQQLDQLQKVSVLQKFTKLKYRSEIAKQTPLEISFNFIPEGSARLLYTPDRPVSDFYVHFLANQSYSIVQNTEKTIRYEGFGISGKGYIYVAELESGWYYLETYFPT